MEKEIILLIGTLIGALITFIGTLISNFLQLKRDKLRYSEEYKIEVLKINSDKLKEDQTLTKKYIIEAMQVFSKIQMTISLTKSVIDSSQKISIQNFHKEYLEENKNLSDLTGKTIVYFPELRDKIETIKNLYNNYWGHQYSVLQENINYENKLSNLKEIIEIGKKVSSEISIIENKLLELADSINKTNIS